MTGTDDRTLKGEDKTSSSSPIFWGSIFSLFNEVPSDVAEGNGEETALRPFVNDFKFVSVYDKKEVILKTKR